MPRRLTVVAVLVAAGLALTACSNDPAAPTAAQDLQTRAQAGLLQSYTASYTLTNTKGAQDGRVIVSRTPSTLRLDVKTTGGLSTSITTPERTVVCQQPANGKAPTCLIVAGPGKTPAAAFDPELRKVFGDALRVLASGDDGVTVTDVAGTTSPTSSPTRAAGETGQCYVVKAPAAASTKLASGTYCFTSDGIPLGLVFPSGTATLSLLQRHAPAASVFVPTTSPTPLPSS